MTEPETYWEDRARETENMLRRVCDILLKHASPYMWQDVIALRDAWQEVIEKLDADWKAAERLTPVSQSDNVNESNCNLDNETST